MNELTQQNVVRIAALLHEDWCKARNNAPRWKYVDANSEWRNGQQDTPNAVDIANTTFDQLPRYWQQDNLFAAKSALDAIYSGVTDVDQLAIAVHDSWRERHGDADDEYTKALLVPFELLPADEQEKDRVIARIALGI